MPAKHPRLTITLKPELAAQLRRLSQLTGNSQSSMIGEMLQGSVEVFARMIEVLEAAESVKAAMKGKLAHDIGAAQTKMEAGLGIVSEGFDEYTESMLETVEAVRGRVRASAAPHAPGTAPPTPISNRGVRSLTNTTKNIAQAQKPATVKPGNDGHKSRGGKK